MTDKEKAEQKAQIEKMKCCGNCKNFKKQEIQNKGNPAIIYRFTCNGLSVAPTMKCKKWELAE